MQFLAVPDDCKTIAAQTAAGRLNNSQRHCAGNCRVHRIAASQQHAQASLRSKRLRSTDHVTAQHG